MVRRDKYLDTHRDGFKFVFIPSGSFEMGSPPTEEGRDKDELQHRVTISRPFYMQVYETTLAQYRLWRKDHALSREAGWAEDGGAERDKRRLQWPVVYVSHSEAQEFAAWLSGRDGSYTYTLPSEAEWEYACRAGTTTPYSVGKALTQADAWIEHGGDGQWLADVGQFSANPWGLFDMHGNALEWCRDYYGPYSGQPLVDPVNVRPAYAFVARGGAFNQRATLARSASRNMWSDDPFSGQIGFRLVARPVPGK